jgi:hypothetical protein
MLKSLFTIIFFLVLKSFGQEDTTKTVTIYGSINSYSFTVPEGWVLQERSTIQLDFGDRAEFYKKDESPKFSTFMNVNAYSIKEHMTQEDIEIKKTLEEQAKKNDIVSKVEPSKNIKTNEGVTAKVKYITQKARYSKNYQAIAHINFDIDGVTITLMTFIKEDFEGSLKAFESLVKSCVIRPMTPQEKKFYNN